jgi:thiamine biosynthesis lipoprotein
LWFYTSFTPSNAIPDKVFTIKGNAQATTYNIAYKSKDSVISRSSIDSLFEVFDYSLSKYNKSSLLYALNQRTRKVKINNHLKAVLEYADSMRYLTNGTFDYRLQLLVDLWGFHSTKSISIPDSNKLNKMLQFAQLNKLTINEEECVKSSTSLRIDLDGIAQGYCVDQLAAYLETFGIHDFIIELGGEVVASGTNIGNENWRVGMATGNEVPKIGTKQYVLKCRDKMAVTTSGSFQKFKQIGDKYFSHIIDPRTGYPVTNGIVAVTVIAPTAMKADGLDNAFVVMGVEKSFEWVSREPDVGLYISYINEKGQLADTANAFFKKYIQETD